jgi:hypothetical protein
MIPDGDITPPGVKLREFTDYSEIRKDVLDSAMNSMSKKFPQEYGNYRVELDDIYYAEKDDYDLAKQKDALMKNSFLSKRLRGKLSLYNKDTGEHVEQKELTLMRVPYITDRGTTIHNGNEYVTLNQARLSSGIYTRKKDSGEIEAHINAKRGSGKSYRIRLEPETSLYKLDVDQASLRLYSLLHDLGVPDDELELRWGPEILEANRAKYDSRVMDKAYNKLVRDKNKDASKEEKAKAILEALQQTRVSKSSLERTLPNLFDMKKAAHLRKFGYQQNPAMQNMQPAQNSEEFVKWDQKRQELEAKAQEKEEKAEFKRDLDERKKRLEIRGLNADLLNEDGKVDNHAVVKQVMQNQVNEQKTEKKIRTNKIVKDLKSKSKQFVEKMKSEDKLQDRYHTIKERGEQDRVQQDKDTMVSQFRSDMGIPEPQPEMPPMMPQQQPMMPKMAKVRVRREFRNNVLEWILRKRILAGGAAYAGLTDEEEPELNWEESDLDGLTDDELQQLVYELDSYDEDIAEDQEVVKESKVTAGSPLDELLQAKRESDASKYSKKHGRMRDLMHRYPQDFFINIKEGEIYGITHRPTNFRMHLPKHVIADLDIADESSDDELHKVALSVMGLEKSSASIPGAAFDLEPPNYVMTQDPLKSCSSCSKRSHDGKCLAFDFRCSKDYVCDAWSEDVEKLAAKGKYKQSPGADNVSLHTKTLSNGHEVDIVKLNELVKDRDTESISLTDAEQHPKLKGANRSKRTGYGPKRYEDADTSQPILVDADNTVIDGRHRYLKSVDEGLDSIEVKRVTDEDIKQCYTDNNHPDSNVVKKL